MEDICLIIDRDVMKKYYDVYFDIHPRAQKVPLPYPYHESINKWMIMKRPMMNALKQKLCCSKPQYDLAIIVAIT